MADVVFSEAIVSRAQIGVHMLEIAAELALSVGAETRGASCKVYLTSAHAVIHAGVRVQS